MAASSEHYAEAAEKRDKRKTSAKMLVTLFPRIPRTASVLLEFFIKRETSVSLFREPLSLFCQEEVVLHAKECLLKLNKQVINYQDLRDMFENLAGLHNMCIRKNLEVAKSLGTMVRKLTIIVSEVATSLEKIAEVSVTDWLAIGDAIVNKLDKRTIPEHPPFSAYIPKIHDFETVRMLGAGGFGAVYQATYIPANFVTTIKLVANDRFARNKQAAMDKVVASVVRSPFLVKYYCCFSVKEAYVTVMEWVYGLDLMRVVTKEQFIEINAVQIIMAQLILALEHLHFRGFLHRDIKVSNMLIMPGGRVKVIDFDTAKTCHGHYSKRILRGYFKRTPFEFNDGEWAGTVPYMAPEILKRRPYGRAADWWSSGIVMYKLMTGRVPFRGKTKQFLRDRIITSPLKWPRIEEHPHSANVPAKDMAYRMLKKNPVERLGSRSYNDLKGHEFFNRLDWEGLYSKKTLCDIPSIKRLLSDDMERKRMTPPGECHTGPHQRVEEMTDLSPDIQKPLFCYTSPSFKKLLTTVKESKTAVTLTETFMDTSDSASSGIDYGIATQGQSSKTATSERDSHHFGPEKIDIILFRRKKFCKYWGYGFKLRKRKGEENNDFIYVESVAPDSPADQSQLLPLDVILSVNGTSVADMPLEKVHKLIRSSSDQMVLSVMAASVYRLLTTRRDMMAFVRTVPKHTLILARRDSTCAGGNPFGIDIIDANTWDSTGKQFCTLFVLTRADVSPSMGSPLFPGDVLTEVGGRELEGETTGKVKQILRASNKDVTITVVPLSSLRRKRIMVSKLRETAITDVNVASKSTGAEIASCVD
ncbi:microtubule-associated serine/threonine-protein kinase 3-like isoform X2 [Ornithodoros turicata]|uniref:microtubule-associated serine/threonine-protein kinase 3-like isoform X2 n=1 Tax=Ornithodoros turicata TaxID=34597 RepID=UPI003138FA38